MTKKTESEIQRAILAVLHAKNVWCWRTNSGGVSYNFKGAPPGTPDIIGILHGGRFFGIECKIEKGELSDIQETWHSKCQAYGGLVGVARSVSDALALIEKWEE